MAVATSTSKKTNHFLKQVIVRLDFSADIKFSADSGPAKLLPAKIRKTFKNQSREKKRRKQVVFGSTLDTVETVQDYVDWIYADSGDGNRIVISNQHLVFEYKEYESFESLNSVVCAVLKNLFNQHSGLIIERFGLRYINNIHLHEPNPTDWKKYIAKNLLGSFQLADDVETIARAFHTLEFSYKDDTRMRFLYGMPNADYPAPIRQKLFVLDFDASSILLADRREVETRLVQFHDRIRAAFDECILEPLREKMHAE